jgi:hypothetical protein
VKERMNEEVLEEKWHCAEYIDDDGVYQKVKWRTVERIGFYIRPLQLWFYPCRKCQAEIKKEFFESTWIFGNKDYEPMIEMNRDFDEIDDDSWITIESHPATKEEQKRFKDGKWHDLPLTCQ